MKKIIINADDFNLTKDINKAIFKLALKNMVSSVSILVNVECDKSILKAKAGLGLHFNLTFGKSLSDGSNIKSLIDRYGYFNKELTDINICEIEMEFNKQLERFIKIYKRQPDHIDTHHHIHYNKKIYLFLLRKTRKLGIPLRKRALNAKKPLNLLYADWTRYRFNHVNAWNKKALIRCIKALREGVTELIVHPGFYSDSLKKISVFAEKREIEYNALNSEEFKEALYNNNIEIIKFADL